MKKIVLPYLLIALPFCVFSQETPTFLEQTSGFHLFRNSNFTTDLKFIDPAKGLFGIDYKGMLERSLGTLNPYDTLYPKNINLNLNSRGFINVTENRNNNNTLISELKFEAFPLIRVEPSHVAYASDDWRNYIDDPDLNTSTDPLIKRSREFAERASAPLWVFLNVHAKHETTQDFKNYDFAFGSSLGFSTSFLNALLDIPFGLLRSSENNNPRQLDLSVGYDLVTEMRRTKLATLRDSSDYMNRLNMKAEWETGIFTGRDRISFLFDSYYDMEATPKVKAAREEFNYFFEIKLDHLLSYNTDTKTLTKISLKYTQGELPPNFDFGNVLGGGFSIEF